MTLEEKFLDYYMKYLIKRYPMDTPEKIASDLAQIAEEGREVIAEGNLEAIYYHTPEIVIRFAGLPKKLSAGKQIEKNKNYKLTLEVQK
jgi:hypothetical protein